MSVNNHVCSRQIIIALSVQYLDYGCSLSINIKNGIATSE